MVEGFSAQLDSACVVSHLARKFLKVVKSSDKIGSWRDICSYFVRTLGNPDIKVAHKFFLI